MKNTRKISPELQSTNTGQGMHRDTSMNKFTTMSTVRTPAFHKAGTMRTPTQRWGMAILERKSYAGLMSFITLYCLFADDFRAAFFSKSADMGFYAVAFVCLLLFLVEFAISCRCKPGYLLSFYFYLDVIATLSLLPDIGFIWTPLTSADTVSSVSKAGSTAGRIVRVVRVIRLIRVVKLIKWKHSNAESELVIVESKTGGRMAEMTIRRVALIVLFLCFVLPAFDGGYNESFNLFESRGFDLIHQMVDTPLTVYTFDVTNPKPGFATPKFELDKRGKEVQVPVDFENDAEYKEIREGLDPAFLEAASNGVELYLHGDWRGAKMAFNQALELRPGDGPVSHVMSYMKSFDYNAPHDWEGVRDLDGY
ncbi:hypothetical protein SDRG_15402 [Saprolegnia diclina VS20]|uniref:Ion transport domain-containing protein n=1 Tax=Saprolegnia diclina (strain VS20) TaxID=1156394 RepID=T0RB12_SAPDV|nr:hypothetical protein SDRG_15402 [Saprolegnia diclina VS20]EQC26752.1 hypothetical protein SDRG_15402 [Saprolegnia diclina VS20]|eukprot:XP_008619795.1 hypothetical protein SDRG_15402 [Saprolegnia diclina VS20]